MSYPFLKGHGTENDFVLLPDHDGTVHGDLTAASGRVRALCDRRAGIGADGVLRVSRGGRHAVARHRTPSGSWTTATPTARSAEMCGNGIRVFARHLVEEGLVDRGGAGPDRAPATA